MASSDWIWLIGGVALGALLASLLGWFVARGRIALAQAAGRAARDPEVAALQREAEMHRHEREAIAGRLADADRSVAELRCRVDTLGDERATLAARAERVDGLDRQLAALRDELASVRGSRQVAETRVAELAARLEEQQQASVLRYRDLEQARERMKLEFQALATGILEDKSRRFGEAQQQQLGQLLGPLRDQLGDFRRAVNEAYEKESNARVALQTRIDDLVRLNQTLGQEAQSLSRALTADNRSQGYWGELKLERLLESAGLEKGAQYLTQESFRGSDGDLYRPDAVLKLPEGKDIIIDAKMVLLDYQRACDCGEDVERDQHMARHATALRNHVRLLGDKDYSRLDGVNAPDLVLLFVPVEGAFLEALRRDPALYDYAFARKIILVGPSNLLASLRLVAQIWRTEQQNRNAKTIADRAATLYDKFVGFAEDLGRVGEALDRAQKMHQSAIGKLSHGKGNLIRQAEMLRELGVAPTKRLAGSLVEAAAAGESAQEQASLLQESTGFAAVPAPSADD